MNNLWPLLNKTISIAVPSIMGFMILILFETVNIFWVGKISSDAVASVGAASFFEWMLFALMNLTTVGCATLSAQRLGAGKHDEVPSVIRDAWHLSMLISFILMGPLFFSMPTLFTWMGMSGEAHQMAVDYFNIFLIGLPILYTLHLQTHIFNAYKDAKTSTWVMGLTVMINMVLDPFLILGWCGAPKLGVQGGAIASLTAQLVGVIIRLWLLHKKNYIGPLQAFTQLGGTLYKKILIIGIPSATTNITWTMVFPFLTAIITQFGMAPLAGLNIGNRLESFPYYFGMGVGWATGVLVGHSIGAQNREDALRFVIVGLGLVTCVLFPMSLAFVFIPEHLVRILIQDPAVVWHASNYLRIIGYFEIFLGWELLLEGAFNGLGYTKSYMFIRVPLTLIRIPLAWFFAIHLGMGVNGVWWAVTLSTLLKGLSLFVAFFNGPIRAKKN